MDMLRRVSEMDEKEQAQVDTIPAPAGGVYKDDPGVCEVAQKPEGLCMMPAPVKPEPKARAKDTYVMNDFFSRMRHLVEVAKLREAIRKKPWYSEVWSNLTSANRWKALPSNFLEITSKVIAAPISALSGCNNSVRHSDIQDKHDIHQAKPHLPTHVMNDFSEAKLFVKNNSTALMLRNMELESLFDSSDTVKKLAHSFSNIQGALALFEPKPLVVLVSNPVCIVLRGFYMQDSNLIMVCNWDKYKSETMLHETVHYAHWRGSGYEMAFKQNDKPTKIRMPRWLVEGFAYSVQDSLKTSSKSSVVTAQIVILLEKICSDQALVRKAFLFGDFNQLQEIVDGKLGKGTIEQIVTSEPKNTNTLLKLLMKKVQMKSERITEQFNQDTRVQTISTEKPGNDNPENKEIEMLKRELLSKARGEL